MLVDGTEEAKLLKILLPRNFVRVPDESERFQKTNSCFREVGAVTFRLAFELMALSLDPLGQRWIFLEAVRDIAMPKFGGEGDKSSVLLHPSILLILVDVHRVAAANNRTCIRQNLPKKTILFSFLNKIFTKSFKVCHDLNIVNSRTII